MVFGSAIFGLIITSKRQTMVYIALGAACLFGMVMMFNLLIRLAPETSQQKRLIDDCNSGKPIPEYMMEYCQNHK